MKYFSIGVILLFVGLTFHSMKKKTPADVLRDRCQTTPTKLHGQNQKLTTFTDLGNGVCERNTFLFSANKERKLCSQTFLYLSEDGELDFAEVFDNKGCQVLKIDYHYKNGQPYLEEYFSSTISRTGFVIGRSSSSKHQAPTSIEEIPIHSIHINQDLSQPRNLGSPEERRWKEQFQNELVILNFNLNPSTASEFHNFAKLNPIEPVKQPFVVTHRVDKNTLQRMVFDQQERPRILKSRARITLDNNSNPRLVNFFDLKGNLDFKLVFSYHNRTGRLASENLFDQTQKISSTDGSVTAIYKKFITNRDDSFVKTLTKSNFATMPLSQEEQAEVKKRVWALHLPRGQSFSKEIEKWLLNEKPKRLHKTRTPL